MFFQECNIVQNIGRRIKFRKKKNVVTPTFHP